MPCVWPLKHKKKKKKRKKKGKEKKKEKKRKYIPPNLLILSTDTLVSWWVEGVE